MDAICQDGSHGNRRRESFLRKILRVFNGRLNHQHWAWVQVNEAAEKIEEDFGLPKLGAQHRNDFCNAFRRERVHNGHLIVLRHPFAGICAIFCRNLTEFVGPLGYRHQRRRGDFGKNILQEMYRLWWDDRFNHLHHPRRQYSQA